MQRLDPAAARPSIRRAGGAAERRRAVPHLLRSLSPRPSPCESGSAHSSIMCRTRALRRRARGQTSPHQACLCACMAQCRRASGASDDELPCVPVEKCGESPCRRPHTRAQRSSAHREPSTSSLRPSPSMSVMTAAATLSGVGSRKDCVPSGLSDGSEGTSKMWQKPSAAIATRTIVPARDGTGAGGESADERGEPSASETERGERQSESVVIETGAARASCGAHRHCGRPQRRGTSGCRALRSAPRTAGLCTRTRSSSAEGVALAAERGRRQSRCGGGLDGLPLNISSVPSVLATTISVSPSPSCRRMARRDARQRLREGRLLRQQQQQCTHHILQQERRRQHVAGEGQREAIREGHLRARARANVRRPSRATRAAIEAAVAQCSSASVPRRRPQPRSVREAQGVCRPSAAGNQRAARRAAPP
jgi:hypothetical protein